jgi:hypothetical protein
MALILFFGINNRINYKMCSMNSKHIFAELTMGSSFHQKYFAGIESSIVKQARLAEVYLTVKNGCI